MYYVLCIAHFLIQKNHFFNPLAPPVFLWLNLRKCIYLVWICFLYLLQILDWCTSPWYVLGKIEQK